MKKPHPCSWEWFLYKANGDVELATSLKQQWIDNITKSRTTKSKFKRLSRDWHIERYGEVEGNLKFEDFRNRSIQTLSNYIRKYGEEEGTKRYNEVISKKSQSKERFIELHGEEEGTKKYNTWKAAVGNLEYLCGKYGEEEGTKRYNKICENRKRSYQQLVLPWKGKTRLQYFVEKHGEEKGLKIFKKWYEGSQMQRSKSSKGALVIFREIRAFCLTLGIQDSDVLYGGDDKHEVIITDDILNITHTYDFCIPSLHFIIEYDGAAWHPTLEQALTDPEHKLPKGKFSWKGKYNWDKTKIKHAEKQGWSVLIFRSDMSIINTRDLIIHCKQLIEEKVNEIYNNKTIRS